MDWANEKYVRLFIRDTTTWKLLPWQARALLPLILRKLDRSGVMDLGSDGEDGLAAVIEVPLEFLQAGLPALLKRDVFRMLAGKLVMPNFMAAQEARQSDAQRKRESRENQRLAALKSQTVTTGPESSQSHSVTTCHTSSDSVTPDYPKTRPDQTKADLPARDPGTTDTDVAAQPEPLDDGPLLPTTPSRLVNCIKAAVEKARPERGFWDPGAKASFVLQDASEFLGGLGDIDIAAPEVLSRIQLFAKDDRMNPWTFAKFRREYNGIGVARASQFEKPKQPQASWGKPVTMADVEAAKVRAAR